MKIAWELGKSRGNTIKAWEIAGEMQYEQHGNQQWNTMRIAWEIAGETQQKQHGNSRGNTTRIAWEIQREQHGKCNENSMGIQSIPGAVELSYTRYRSKLCHRIVYKL